MATKKAVKVEQVLDDKTASVAKAISEEGVLHDRAMACDSYAQFERITRMTGPTSTVEGISFGDDDLDREALDALIEGITG